MQLWRSIKQTSSNQEDNINRLDEGWRSTRKVSHSQGTQINMTTNSSFGIFNGPALSSSANLDTRWLDFIIQQIHIATSISLTLRVHRVTNDWVLLKNCFKRKSNKKWDLLCLHDQQLLLQSHVVLLFTAFSLKYCDLSFPIFVFNFCLNKTSHFIHTFHF